MSFNYRKRLGYDFVRVCSRVGGYHVVDCYLCRGVGGCHVVCCCCSFGSGWSSMSAAEVSEKCLVAGVLSSDLPPMVSL